MTTIAAIRILPYSLSLRRPWVSARGETRRRDGYLVRIETETGKTGFGDCAPLTGAGTESLERAERVLRQMIGEFSTTSTEKLIEALVSRRGSSPAACAGLETACLEIEARIRKVPIARMLNLAAGHSVQVNAMIGGLDETAAERALEAAEHGYKVVKLKLGIGPVAEEIARLERQLARFPAGLKVRLDANEAWSMDQARTVLAALRDLPIEAVEEPCGRADATLLAELQALVPFPLALDESLPRRGVDQMIAKKPVRRLVLKLPVLGGPLAAYSIGRRALKAGIEVVVTSVVDSAIGVLAAAHVAIALDAEVPEERRLAHGLATSTWVERDVGPGPAPVMGRIAIAPLPGLGMVPPIP